MLIEGTSRLRLLQKDPILTIALVEGDETASTLASGVKADGKACTIRRAIS